MKVIPQHVEPFYPKKWIWYETKIELSTRYNRMKTLETYNFFVWNPEEKIRPALRLWDMMPEFVTEKEKHEFWGAISELIAEGEQRGNAKNYWKEKV